MYYIPPRSNGVIKNINNWKKFLKEHKDEYNTIHVHVSSLTAITPIVIAKKYKIKNRIIHSHNILQRGKIHEILSKINEKRILKYATKMFACSREAGEKYFPKDKFEIIKNGIDAEKYIYNSEKKIQMREKLNISNETAYVHIGRFNEQKNHKFLIDIFNQILKLDSNCKLFLIGDGELKESINQKIKEYKIQNNVVFLGLRDDIWDVLQAMDIMIFPSLYEGLGIVGIEGQASGIPVFVSDVVPKEIKVTDLVQVISLNKTNKEWAENIVNNKKKERKNKYNEIVAEGYDIKNTIKKLEEYYFK